MKHAEEVDYQKRKEQIIQQWKAENGIKCDVAKAEDVSSVPDSWMDVLKVIRFTVWS